MKKVTSILITKVKDYGLVVMSNYKIIALPDGRIDVCWTNCGRFIVKIGVYGGHKQVQGRRGQVGIHV